MTEYAFRTEPFIDQGGARYRIVYRRRILSQSDDFIELGAVERAVLREAEPARPSWEPTGGLLGRPCQITRERYRACGYSATPPAEIHDHD
jgi:hypothetical protein